MKHKQYQEWLQLYLYDELSEDEKKLLVQHLNTCDKCRAELEQLQSFHKILMSYQPSQISEKLLQKARNDLQVKIYEYSKRKNIWRYIADAMNYLLTPKVQVAIGGVVVGILIGYFVFRFQGEKIFGLKQTSTSVMEAGESRLTNIRFLERNAQTGDVEFSFDAVVPMHVRGNVDDENIQKVLARIAVSEENIGTRLRAVGMLGMKSEEVYKGKPELENEIKLALITVLLHDENLGVRREALNALKQYLPDTSVVRAFLTIIRNEKNVSLKIAAINAINISELKNQPLGREIIELLKQKAQSDENNYVKIKAITTLQEIEQ